jgi:hypothetical protein
MKRNWKKLSLIGVAIAALAACNKSAPFSPSELGSSGASELTSSRDGSAGLLTPTARAGNGAPRGQLVFSWNLIGTPDDYQGGCGDGRRIFVERDVNNAHIQITNGSTWSIVDCNATGGNMADMTSNDLGIYDVYVRILGKTGGHFDVCAAHILTDDDTDETLCLLGRIDLTRESGQSKFQVQPDSLFDASLEDVFWSVDTNKDFRIAQFRVYEEGQ